MSELSLFARSLMRFVAWTLCASVIAFVLLQQFPPSGMIEKSFRFDGSSIWLYPFQPGERVTSPGKQPDQWVGQRITAEPVYTTVRLPGPFDRLEVAFDIRAKDQPLAELGILRDEEAFQFEYKPFFSEQLTKGWQEAEYQGVHGFIRNDGVPSDLLSKDPQRVLVWGADSPKFELNDTVPLSRSIDINLRGTHEFWIVPVDGVIDMSFVLQDANRARAGTQNVSAFVLRKGSEIILTEPVSVSGSLDAKMSQPFTKRIFASGLSSGIYRLTFQSDDDFFIRHIESSMRRWVVGPRFYAGDSVGYKEGQASTTWLTNSQHITAEVRHADSLQTISFGALRQPIERTHTVYALSRDAKDVSAPWLTVSQPLSNIRIIGDGYFAVDEQAAFVPTLRRLTAETKPLEEGIIAIRTPYKTPISLGDNWYQVSTFFDLPDTSESQKLSLGLPGIESRLGAFDIRSVRLRFTRPSLSAQEFWQTIKAEARRAYKRLQ
ncbi:MAG TPA: hypothetical protein PLR08_03975 [bacterium]|nr:hypothetical protein [Candidatus Magasanikbacteria bacterium]MCA9388974.1 hypothetical protein [Candidatus Magasanikbacteria bacterium]USN52037.1 MAG: hypothetical protein H6759_03320 [Candidatus Nomurabacteria bacterium]HPF95681.1 hypothetical protein [bacterium]